jgi:hypothetical protein
MTPIERLEQRLDAAGICHHRFRYESDAEIIYYIAFVGLPKSDAKWIDVPKLIKRYFPNAYNWDTHPTSDKSKKWVITMDASRLSSCSVRSSSHNWMRIYYKKV